MLLLGLMVVGCEKEYEAPEEQPVLFEYRYVNFAWGYSEHGWLIDAEGEVHRYDFPEDYRLPDSLGYICVEDLNYNLTQCDSILDSVESADLDYYVGLIQGASGGQILDMENVAADAGISTLSCYLYIPHKDMYKYVFLAQSGDWEQINDSREAKTLVTWLKEIGEVFWLAI